MNRFLNRIKDESAGVMVENVIVLPLVFVIILFMVVSAFMVHDLATIESAARRGAIYASHCIIDPGYSTLVGNSGELDISKDVANMNFGSVGKNLKSYRYILNNNKVESLVVTEVTKIVEKTRINWIPQERIQVTCQQKNKIFYQDITVNVSAVYQLPKWFEWFGLESDYTVSTSAKLAAVDPDEFIRNADLVVDLITDLDKATGSHLEKITEKIVALGAKILDWIELG